MRTVSYRLADLHKATIRIGRVGENDYTRVIFDGKQVFDEYPRAVPALTVESPAGARYPAVCVREGDLVIWDVKDSDLVSSGMGEAQLTFTEDGVVCKSCIANIRVERSITASGEAPDPVEDWLTAANTALNAIPQTIDDALAEAKASGEFDGEDGFSPVVSVTEITDGHRVSVTDAEGTETFDVMNGEPGQPGQPGAPGQPGVSPIITVTDITGGHRITITDASGTKTVDVMDGDKGDPGDPTELIDDSAGAGDTGKTWSANKLAGDIGAKYTKPVTGIPATDLESGVIPSVPVQDVQVDGVSVLSQGVANVPMADMQGNPGVIKMVAGNGIGLSGQGNLTIVNAISAAVKNGTNNSTPIVPLRQHESVYYGLAKLAGADMASLSGETVGVYPEAQKIAIQKMLGLYEAPWELIREDTFTNATEANHIITVDGNGEAFELTDVIVLFETPSQETQAKFGGSGEIRLHYGIGSYDYLSVTCGNYTQNANGYAHGCNAKLTQDHKMLSLHRTASAETSNYGNVAMRYTSGFGIPIVSSTNRVQYVLRENPLIINKITIGYVTGTGHYILYGKRKWWT